MTGATQEQSHLIVSCAYEMMRLKDICELDGSKHELSLDYLDRISSLKLFLFSKIQVIPRSFIGLNPTSRNPSCLFNIEAIL